MDMQETPAPWRWYGWVPAVLLGSVLVALTVLLAIEWDITNAHGLQIVILCFGYFVLGLVMFITLSTRKHHKQ